MIQSFTVNGDNNEVGELNNFIQKIDSKIIIVNKHQRLLYYFNEITNIRISKKRNLYPNLIVVGLGFSTLYIALSFRDYLNVFAIMNIFFSVNLFIDTFFLKKYSYKLLINNGKSGFSEITIPTEHLEDVHEILNNFNKNKTITLSTS